MYVFLRRFLAKYSSHFSTTHLHPAQGVLASVIDRLRKYPGRLDKAITNASLRLNTLSVDTEAKLQSLMEKHGVTVPHEMDVDIVWRCFQLYGTTDSKTSVENTGTTTYLPYLISVRRDGEPFDIPLLTTIIEDAKSVADKLRACCATEGVMASRARSILRKSSGNRAGYEVRCEGPIQDCQVFEL